jgi:hypothetical protein
MLLLLMVGGAALITAGARVALVRKGASGD